MSLDKNMNMNNNIHFSNGNGVDMYMSKQSKANFDDNRQLQMVEQILTLSVITCSVNTRPIIIIGIVEKGNKPGHWYA